MLQKIKQKQFWTTIKVYIPECQKYDVLYVYVFSYCIESDKKKLNNYSLKGNCTENKNLGLYQEYITFIAYNRFPRIETLSKIIGTRNRR